MRSRPASCTPQPVAVLEATLAALGDFEKPAVKRLEALQNRLGDGLFNGCCISLFLVICRADGAWDWLQFVHIPGHYGNIQTSVQVAIFG